MISHLSESTRTHPISMAYLIRLWQDTPNGPWRASAQSVQTGEIIRFGSQYALCEFLENAVDKINQQNTGI